MALRIRLDVDKCWGNGSDGLVVEKKSWRTEEILLTDEGQGDECLPQSWSESLLCKNFALNRLHQRSKETRNLLLRNFPSACVIKTLWLLER